MDPAGFFFYYQDSVFYTLILVISKMDLCVRSLIKYRKRDDWLEKSAFFIISATMFWNFIFFPHNTLSFSVIRVCMSSRNKILENISSDYHTHLQKKMYKESESGFYELHRSNWQCWLQSPFVKGSRHIHCMQFYKWGPYHLCYFLPPPGFHSSPPFFGYWSVTWQNDAKRSVQKKTYIEEGQGESWTQCLWSSPCGVRTCHPLHTSVCGDIEHCQPGKFTVPRGFIGALWLIESLAGKSDLQRLS